MYIKKNSALDFTKPKGKKTKQGDGKRSKPSHGRKQKRGQGK
jgi:hypothetical protein